jgi:hypothetical protein
MSPDRTSPNAVGGSLSSPIAPGTGSATGVPAPGTPGSGTMGTTVDRGSGVGTPTPSPAPSDPGLGGSGINGTGSSPGLGGGGVGSDGTGVPGVPDR